MKDERLPNRSSKSSFARLSRAICRHRPLLPPRHYSILEGSTFLSPQIPFYFARLSSQETSVRWRENEKIALITRAGIDEKRLNHSGNFTQDACYLSAGVADGQSDGQRDGALHRGNDVDHCGTLALFDNFLSSCLVRDHAVGCLTIT